VTLSAMKVVRRRMSELGPILVSARRKAGMTLRDVSEKSNLSRATIINYEKGRRMPRVDDLQKIADALGCEVNVLIPNPPLPPTPEVSPESGEPGGTEAEPAT
jgi:transcriptional regulator with XRE-family HTH domain